MTVIYLNKKMAATLLIGTLAKHAAGELIVDVNTKVGEEFSIATKTIYQTSHVIAAAETQTTGKNTDAGFALKTKGNVSAQLDGDNEGSAEAKFILDDDGFCAIAGVGRKKSGENFDCGKYAAVSYRHGPFSSPDNFGAGGFVTGMDDRAFGGYIFGRVKGIFGGYNWAPSGERFVFSIPNESGWAARWFDLHNKGFSYDQFNVTSGSEVLTGVDSYQALHDAVTNTEDSPVAPAIFPLRFRSRPDERGHGMNAQFSRTKLGKKKTYFGELDAETGGGFWLGGNYNTDGKEYGISAGRTEHFRYGKGRVPFSVRGDMKYNSDRKSISAGLYFAKKFR